MYYVYHKFDLIRVVEDMASCQAIIESRDPENFRKSNLKEWRVSNHELTQKDIDDIIENENRLTK